MAITPLSIPAGLSASDQAAVAAAYQAGGGSASNISYGSSTPTATSAPVLQKAPVGIYPDYTSKDNVNWTYAPTGASYYMPSLAPQDISTTAPNSLSATTIGSGAPSLPSAPITDYTGVLNAIKAGMAPNDIYQSITGKSATQNPTQPGTTDPNSMENLFKQYLDSQTPPPSTTDIYNQEYQNAGIQQKQQAVNDYTAQLNSITAKAQADQLSVTGQGRGIPEAIIGGQQAQIAKEAAIQALPIAAQLAAAQGNLQLAQSHLDTVFQMRTADAQSAYTYKSNIIKSVYDFATAAQKRKLDALDQQQQNNFTLMRDAIAQQNALSKSAMDNGQPDIAAKIAAVDPNSPTYQSDLSNLQSQISIQKPSDLQFVSGSTNQPSGVFNKTTGTFTPTGGGGPNAGGTGTGTYNGEFAATIDLAAQVGGTNQQRTQIKQNLQNFIAQGDYPSAYATVLQSVSKGLTGANASTFQGQANSLGVLQDLKTAMTDYANAGGNTNIFKGTADSIQNKMGALMTDPKYASLAVQLTAAFQAYRLQMTGAAFGAAESAEYASILPGKGNTLDLNLAKLNGASAYLDSSVNASIRSVVGDGGVYIKERAMPQTQTITTASDASIFDSAVGGSSSSSGGVGGFFSDILKGLTGG